MRISCSATTQPSVRPRRTPRGRTGAGPAAARPRHAFGPRGVV